ncbi:T-complex-associated testis-expressed protein 1, partial [Borealophlyctis nickersoniae]
MAEPNSTDAPPPTTSAPSTAPDTASARAPTTASAAADGGDPAGLFEPSSRDGFTSGPNAVDTNMAGMTARQKMMAQRRIIAEDPEWNLAPVEKLSELCVRVIVANFEKTPLLTGIPTKYRDRVLSSISVTLPLPIAAPLIPDEPYWHRRATSAFKLCDPDAHGKSWKRLFFELHIRNAVEQFVPKREGGVEEELRLVEELKLAAPFVVGLEVGQLRPMEP